MCKGRKNSQKNELKLANIYTFDDKYVIIISGKS